jgi:hypothetical protein
MYIQQLTEAIQNVVGMYKEITLPIIYQVVTLPKLIYVSIEISHLLVLPVCCKLVNTVLQIFPLFVPKMSSSSRHCSGYTHSFDLDPVAVAIWLVFFDLIILNIVHQTMAYDASVHSTNSLWLKCDIFSNSFPKPY